MTRDLHECRPAHSLPEGQTAENHIPEGVDHWYALILLADMTLRGDRARRVWERHREAAIAEWIKVAPGTRPKFWWTYDAPEPLPKGESQAAYLARHNLLTPVEKRRLPQAARELKPQLKVIQ
ncbi:hypothetical protein [Povalibacter uvarum]|uniref:hypothetical protein n=1 Tax=Povalibacter uvarum TaxID=732238 RepID=UPI001C842C1E|nr:hypothetical protein [Povalibacter uvarum]